MVGFPQVEKMLLMLKSPVLPQVVIVTGAVPVLLRLNCCTTPAPKGVAWSRNVSPAGDRTRFGVPIALPVRGTTCLTMLLFTFSTMTRLPVRAPILPVARGVKNTLTVQLAPGTNLMLILQVLSCW